MARLKVRQCVTLRTKLPYPIEERRARGEWTEGKT